MIEIDMVVSDALAAFSLYERAFNAVLVDNKRAEVAKGASFNEVVFELQRQQFHLFDEKVEIGWVAPLKEVPQSVWFNLITNDAEKLYQQALLAGMKTVVALTEDAALGVKNAVLHDSFGYSWVIEQIIRPISFAERCQVLAARFAANNDKKPSTEAFEGGDDL